jgi:hypothetical protein
MAPLCCLETSVGSYHYSLRHNLQERSSQTQQTNVAGMYLFTFYVFISTGPSTGRKNSISGNSAFVQIFLFAQQPYSGLGHLTVEVSRLHTNITHTRQDSSGPVIGPMLKSLTTHHIHKKKTSMPLAGFEPAIAKVRGHRPPS